MSISRRRLLGTIIQGLGIALALGHRMAPWVHAQEGVGVTKRTDPHIVRVARPLDAETPVETFGSFLTPINRFFIRSHFGPPSEDLVAEKNWRLTVGGLVARPLTFARQDLKQLEEVTITAVVQCSGNGRAFYRPRVPGVQWERGAVGNARWTGVRLRDVLNRAGLQAGGHHVQFQGADRPVASTVPLFVRSIPIEKALHPDTILAYQMNGRPLPLLHGAPLRVVTPGWMADACIKWLTDITVLEEEAKGYYMQTAYRYPVKPVEPGSAPTGIGMKPVETMVVKSLITAPVQGTTVSPGNVMIQGVAWTGEGKIVQVEVSTDEGRTWEEARLVGEDQPYAWRQWQYIWKVEGSGPRTILCRATDDHGQTQPRESPWNPSGFLWNGWDRATLTVAG